MVKNEPRVGVGWIIDDDKEHPVVIVGHSWKLTDGEVIGERFCNPPRGHDDVWPEIRDGLDKYCYPYEYYPRFRVIKDIADGSFRVWGDQKIMENAEWQAYIRRIYFLPEAQTEFLTDEHYYSANPDTDLILIPRDSGFLEGELFLVCKSFADAYDFNEYEEAKARGYKTKWRKK